MQVTFSLLWTFLSLFSYLIMTYSAIIRVTGKIVYVCACACIPVYMSVRTLIFIFLARLKTEIFRVFCARLLHHFRSRSDDLYFWAASCHHNHAPEKSYLGHGKEHEGWELQRFTRPLSSPPSVIREITKAMEIKNNDVFGYTKREVPDHTDGPAVHWVNHQIKEHQSNKIHDCYVCGNHVATFLCKKLRLGKSVSCK